MADVRLTATNPQDSSVVPVACNSKGELLLEQPPEVPEFDGNLDGDLNVSGSATFTGTVNTGAYDPSSGTASGTIVYGTGGIYTQAPSSIQSGSPIFQLYYGTSSNFRVRASGAAEFAGGKAGFTAEGYLWCTTRRGDRVILDATSNGLGSWVEYPQTQTQDL